MAAAVRKKDEELTINLKCIISVLMTDWGLSYTLRIYLHYNPKKAYCACDIQNYFPYFCIIIAVAVRIMPFCMSLFTSRRHSDKKMTL